MCKHEEISIIEYSIATTFRYREDDGEWLHDSDFGDYTGKLEVKCRQCGLKRTYYRSRLPKWLQSRLAEIGAT